MRNNQRPSGYENGCIIHLKSIGDVVYVDLERELTPSRTLYGTQNNISNNYSGEA